MKPPSARIPRCVGIVNLIVPASACASSDYHGDQHARRLANQSPEICMRARCPLVSPCRLRYDVAMTDQESIALIKELIAVKSKEELQQKMGENLSRVDSTFFSVVNEVAAHLRAQGKADAARQLNAIGDSLARLRFMI